MATGKPISPTYSFDKPTYVKFLDRTDFSLAKYNDISLEGFSCFCNKTIQPGSQHRVEINLKMVTGGLIDNTDMHIATAELIEIINSNDKKIHRFKYLEFSENCAEDLIKAVGYLDHKEKLIALPDISKDNLNAQNTIIDIVKDLSDLIEDGHIALPVLPKIVRDVEDAVRNPNTTSSDIAKAIEQDAVISIKLISTANSSFYRGTSHIISIKEAIPRLGIKEVQNLVLTIANKSLYNTKSQQYKTLLEKLWLHSLACAVIAKTIAMKLKLDNADSYFTIGLVHDIGQTMLLRVIGEMTDVEKPFETKDIIECTNMYKSEICANILKFWNFEKQFIDCATNYKEIQPEQTTDNMKLVINIANNMTYNLGFGLYDRSINLEELKPAKTLNLSAEILKEVEEETVTKMHGSGSAF